MKKNVKYISSAVTVALLIAGAPVIVPMLMPTTTVEAYNAPSYSPYTLENGGVSDGKVSTFLTHFMDQFRDQYISSPELLAQVLEKKEDYLPGWSYFDPGHLTSIFDIQSDPHIKMLKDPSKLDTDQFESSGGDYYYRDIVGYLQIIDGNGNPLKLTNKADYDAAIKGFRAGTIKFPLSVDIELQTSKDSDNGDPNAQYGNYNPPSLETEGVTKAMTSKKFTVTMSEFDLTTDTTNVTVSGGTSIDSSALTSGKNALSITDRYADSTNDKNRTPNYGKILFTDKNKAINFAKSTGFSSTATTADGAAQLTDNKITSAGEYYQTVSYKLDNGNDEAITAMISGNSDKYTGEKVLPYYTYINGSNNLATEGTDYFYNQKAGTLTVIRPVVVTNVSKAILDTPNVTVGDSAKTDNPVLSDTTNDKLEDDNNNIIPTSKVEFGDTYYTDDKGNNEDTSLVDSNGKFTKSGNYYRKVTFTLTDGDTSYLTNDNGAVNKSGNTITYMQEVDVKNGAKSNISTAQATVGDSEKTEENTEIADLANTLKDADGNSLVKSTDANNGIQFGSQYYDAGTSDDMVLNSTTSTTEPINIVDKNGDFTKSGTYLRTITFQLVDKAMDKNSFDSTDSKYKLNTQNNTVTYVQKVIISALKAKVKYTMPEVSVGTTNDDPKLTDITGDTLVDGKGNSIVDTKAAGTDQGIEFGQDIYSDSFLKNKVAGIDHVDTYYRQIIFHITEDAVNNIDFTGTGATVDKTAKTATFVQTINATTAPAVDSYTNPIKVTYGTSTTDSRLTDSGTSATMIDSLTKDSILLTDGGITLGTTYYDSPEDAMAGDTSKASQYITSGRFTNLQKYYRTITFNLTKGAAAAHSFPTGGVVKGDTVTYIQTIDVSKASGKVSIADISTHSSVLVKSLDVAGDGDYSLSNDNGSLIAENGTSFSDSYYDSAPAALDGSGTTTAGVTNGEFTKEGDYFRTVTFKLKPGAGSENTFPGSDGVDYKLDGDNITFVQKVHVAENPATATIANVNADAGSLTANLNNTNGNTVKTETEASIVLDNGISFGDKYYATKPDVIKAATDSSVKTTDDVKDGKFLAAGEYWRTITFSLKSLAATADKFTGDDIVEIDKTNDKVTYAQRVTISPVDATASINKAQTTTGIDINTDPNLNITAGNDIKSKYGSIVAEKGISFSDKYYDTPEAALAGGAGTETKGIKNGKFVIGGPDVKYYRRINFKLVDNALLANDLIDKNYGENADGSIFYVQEVDVDKQTASPTIATPTVVAGTGTDSDAATKGNDLKVGETSIVGAKGVSFGDDYYANADGTSPVSDVVNNGKFVKAGTYYRKVIFNLDAGTLDADDIAENPTRTIDGDTVTYLQKIVISPLTVTASVTDPISVQAGTPTSAVVDTTGDTLSDGTNTIASDVKADTTTFYNNIADALAGKNPATDAVRNDRFANGRKDPYYRVITFTPATGTIGEYQSGADNIKINGNGTITYVQAINVSRNDAKATAAVNSLNVAVDVSGDTDSALSNPANYDLTDDKGNTLVDKTKGDAGNGISFDKTYYETNDKGTLSDVSKYAQDYTIKRPNTYYRKLTFNLLPGNAEAYDFASLGGTVSDDTVTFIQKVTATAAVGSDKIQGTSAKTGSSVKNLNNSQDVSVTGKNDQQLIASQGPQFGSLYDTKEAAQSNGATSSYVDKNGTINKAGTYYQRVTVPLIENGGYAYTFPADGMVDKDANTVTFVRAITVTDAPNNNGHHSSGNNSGNNNNTDDDWTYYQDKGVVTTKTDQPTYTLNNHENQTIANRGLAEDTAWVTDQYRVNKAGVKQYRVATGEWIDSHDVIFTQKNTDTNDDWTYYQDPGVVTTKDNQAYYSLENWDNQTVTNRALAEQTMWVTDQYRTNKAGVKEYRVATNEWINAQDVIFTKDIKKVVNLDESENIYQLYSLDGKLVSNRALSKRTSWFTDKEAIDSTGNVYYHVATGEWIKQIKGVNLDDSAWY